MIKTSFTIDEWNALTEENKLKILRNDYKDMRSIIKAQMLLINSLKKNKVVASQPAFDFIYVMLNEFWEQIDFIVAIGKNKYRKFNSLLIRSMFEKFLQISFFTSKNLEERNLITLKEQIRVVKKFYEREKNADGSSPEWLKQYQDLREVFLVEFKKFSIPDDPNELTLEHIEPFPKPKEMCSIVSKQFNHVDPEKWYHDYKYYCEFDHNGFFMIWQRQEKMQYRQNLMIALAYSKMLLRLVDGSYLEKKTKIILEDYLKKHATLKK